MANIETIARRLVDLKLTDKSRAEVDDLVRPIVEDLDDDTRAAALARATEIKQAKALLYQADQLDGLDRLLNMPGCPKGKAGWNWLLKRALIERTGLRGG
jgi:hypothetical protein